MEGLFSSYWSFVAYRDRSWFPQCSPESCFPFHTNSVCLLLGNSSPSQLVCFFLSLIAMITRASSVPSPSWVKSFFYVSLISVCLHLQNSWFIVDWSNSLEWKMVIPFILILVSSLEVPSYLSCRFHDQYNSWHLGVVCFLASSIP